MILGDNSPKPARDISLDLIRFIAIFMVICIHICAKGFVQMDQKHWWAINVYESLSRIAVPLFFMVTGALLLHRESSVSAILTRMWRIALPLFCWSVLYLCWYKFKGYHHSGWIPKILRTPVSPHFWYLYTLLGAYLFLPVMAGFFQANKLKTLLFVLGAWFIGASLVPTIFSVTQKDYLGIDWHFLPLYAGYIVLGAVLYRKPVFGKPPLALALLAWAVCSIATIVLTWFWSSKAGHGDETFLQYSSPFVVVGSIGAFIAMREICRKDLSQLPWLNAALGALSRVNFGVYLCHVITLYILDEYGFDHDVVNPWLAIPLVTTANFILSALTVALLQRIPCVRAIVPT